MRDSITRLNTALEGRYRIESELGEGGMANVYLADDIKHERRVALKVLKPELAAVVGADRFLAEIKTTANLQHPHILPLFDSGEADSFLFYVMPFVEGETLRDRLEREKQLPVDEAVRIATDVAEALQAAHEQGVIHRDIKPANILMNKGRPLVADFGIALAVSAAGGGRLTETGLSMGTPFYMSPEQASADREPSAASDVYSLGCVLYEMLVGEPPYTASSAQAVLAKILTEDARSPTSVRSSIPPNVDAAIRKALEKLPADRFTGAKDFARALADPSFMHGATAVAAAAGAAPRALALPWALLAISVVLGAWGWLGAGEVPAPATPIVLDLDHSDLEEPNLRFVEISPDGRFIGVPTRSGIAIRPADQANYTLLPGTEGVRQFAFSPDGAWLVYSKDGALWRSATVGSSPLLLVRNLFGDGMPHWGQSGAIVFADGTLIRMIPAGGGDPVTFDPVGGRPHVLPDGSAILMNTQDGIGVLDVETGEFTALVEGGAEARYVPTGHLLFVHRDGGLFAAPFDLDTKRVTGPVMPVVAGVSVAGGDAFYSVSETGTLIYPSAAGGQAEQQLVFFGPAGSTEPVRLSPRALLRWDISRDGRWIAFNEGVTRTTTRALFAYDQVRGELSQLAFEGGEHSPRWSPDGTHVVYSVATAGDQDEDLYVLPVDGSAPPRRLVTMPLDQHAEDWSTDGVIAFSSVGGDLYYVDAAATDGEPNPFLVGEQVETGIRISLDGRLAAYASNEDGIRNIYIRRFPEADVQRRITTNGGNHPEWSADGRTIYYRALSADTVYAARLRLEPAVSVARTELAWVAPNTVAPWAFDAASGRGLHAQMIGPTEALPDPHVTVVVNWFEELKRLAPTGNRR